VSQLALLLALFLNMLFIINKQGDRMRCELGFGENRFL